MPMQTPTPPPAPNPDIRPAAPQGSPEPISAPPRGPASTPAAPFPSFPSGRDRRSRPRPGHGPHPSTHTVPFEVEDKSCSQVLFDLMQTAPRDGMTVRALIHALGERGLLMACM